MRAILIFFTLLLTLAWAYTSWYWYTCNIKGFCDVTSFSFSNDERVEQAKAKLMPERVVQTVPSQPAQQTPIGNIVEKKEVSQTPSQTENSELPRVLFDETVEVEEVDKVEESINTEAEAVEKNVVTSEETESTCKTPLTGPIEFGKNNDIAEVKILEKFLISQGETLDIDGKYEQIDFEAVKRFQLKYKSEILDPWGVTEPTGFVFRTTVKKINEIACK